MQTTSNLFKTLLASTHTVESRVIIDGTTFGEADLYSVRTTASVFPSGSPSVGNCVAREIDIEMRMPNREFARMAKIQPYMRLTNGTQNSEWIPKGVFYIDTREYDKESGKLFLHGYDAILLMEGDYPNTTHNWPYRDISVVNEIASTVGMSVDSRTTSAINKSYNVQFPVNYTMREVLGFVGAMYGGNFISSDSGKLLFVGLNSIPPETYYLIDEEGNYITVGGDRILIG